MHPLRAAPIAALKQNDAPTKILPKYINNADVFSFNLVMELPKNIGIKKHAVELQESKQPSYKPIYSLRPIELEILKTYIETYLKTRFIQFSKSPTDTPNFFDKKPDGSLQLYVNY